MLSAGFRCGFSVLDMMRGLTPPRVRDGGCCVNKAVKTPWQSSSLPRGMGTSYIHEARTGHRGWPIREGKLSIQDHVETNETP